VVIIGNDPEEWVEDREGLKAWMTEGGGVKAAGNIR